MNKPIPIHRTRSPRQRGMVTIVVMLFLIATVIFALSQMLNVSSGTVIDGQRQGDSHAAFFVAESGLERATASVANALSGTFTHASCTGLAGTSNIGAGTVTLSAVSAPASCDNSGATPCTGCSVTSVGVVGSATRTLTQELSLLVRNGTFCTSNCGNSPTVTWQLTLKNSTAYAGIGVFALSYDEQGNNQATCPGGSVCRLQVDVDSPASGTNSAGLMGNTWEVPAGTSRSIYQVMSQGSRSLAEVGGFFYGSAAAPTLTGPTSDPGAASYWDMRNSQSAGSRTVGRDTDSTGATNDGTWTSTGTCAAPTNSNSSSQSCTSWCSGGDTLVYLFSGNATALSSQLTTVTFGTNVHSVPMTQLVKYPIAGIAGAPTNVHAEIWYARNANLSGSTTEVGAASSYKGRGTAAVGASWTSNNTDTTSISASTFTVGASFAGWPSSVISVGDTVSYSGGGGPSPACTANTVCGTITAQVTPLLAGEAMGGRGRYTLSGALAVGSVNNRVWTVNSNVLRVSACTICNIEGGDALPQGLISGRTISSQASLSTDYSLTEATGGVGRYIISGTPTRVASGTNLYAGTPGSTLYLSSTSTAFPSLTTPAMRLKVKSVASTGAFAAGSTVTAVSAAGSPNAATRSFTMSAAPVTALDNATICAGTCAFFAPGTTAETSYSMSTISGNFNGWAGGFTCLKGVDLAPSVVSSSTASATRWKEVVQ